jgi:hypothetical protein
MYWLSGSL